MYETYFNLTERPFASVPRIDHYYPAAVIDAARNTLTRCIDRGEGVAMIIGPSGTGKSLLCQVLAEQFQTGLPGGAAGEHASRYAAFALAGDPLRVEPALSRHGRGRIAAFAGRFHHAQR